MSNNFKNFNIKIDKLIPVDEFIDKILYNPNKGYYSRKIPFGKTGDYITSPTISNLFSEIISIWFVSTWEKLGKPKKLNIVELGPGDGSLSKVLVDTLVKFPKVYKAINIFLYEKSDYLIKEQKKKIKNSKVRWIKDFKLINGGPVIFFGNEFFDAIPIKQFLYKRKTLFEKCFLINSSSIIKEKYKKANEKDLRKIQTFKVLKKNRFIEFPKQGFIQMDKIVKKIKKLSGGILLIDYGYLQTFNQSTLQAVKRNKKMNMKYLYKNLGEVDITSLVNFSLLKEYFLVKNLKVKKIVPQKFFLEKMGIMERAKILEKNMTQKQKDYMIFTLKRLLHKSLMGELFKVIFAYKSKHSNFLGFK